MIKASQKAQRIAVGISGGQNSAVTAALLKSQGYEVIGIYLSLCGSNPADDKRFFSRCCQTKSLQAAQSVCQTLEIPLHVVAMEEQFQDKVVDHYLHESLACRQPNLCVSCNRDVRFAGLFKKADELKCAQVATGHHAQIFQESAIAGRPASARLIRSVNLKKDQSYLLYGLNQAQLSRLLFPLGGFQDAMIDRLAQQFELPASSPASLTEGCALRGDALVSFVESRTPEALRPHGVIQSVEGSPMGEHKGLYHYQVGQKVKLEVSSSSDQYYVVSHKLSTHILVVGAENQLEHSSLRATQANWVNHFDGLRGMSLQARYHSQQLEPVDCRITLFENETVLVEFASPQRGLVPGQPIVFYQGDEVLGGALIDHVGNDARG